jgi:hypothetical protein
MLAPVSTQPHRPPRVKALDVLRQGDAIRVTGDVTEDAPHWRDDLLRRRLGPHSPVLGADVLHRYWTPFTYRVPGDYLRVERDGREINRSLSRTNFEKAAKLMPAATPSDIKGSQGSAYTWAILMDRRVRQGDW